MGSQHKWSSARLVSKLRGGMYLKARGQAPFLQVMTFPKPLLNSLAPQLALTRPAGAALSILSSFQLYFDICAILGGNHSQSFLSTVVALTVWCNIIGIILCNPSGLSWSTLLRAIRQTVEARQLPSKGGWPGVRPSIPQPLILYMQR